MKHERWAQLSDREAVGEALSAEDRAFLRDAVEGDAAIRAENELWQRFSDESEDMDELRERAIVSRVLESVQGAPQAFSPSRRREQPRLRVATWTGLAMAAAAAVALGIWSRGMSPDGQGLLPTASVVSNAGTLTIGDEPANEKTVLSSGAEARTASGTACLKFEPGIVACLGSNSRVRLTALQGPRRRLDLLAGSVALALDAQPRGERFSVVAGGIWSTAVGTAFSVELNEQGVVQTSVYEGKVLVGGEETGELVGMHKIALASKGAADVQAMDAAAAAARGAEWAALEKARNAKYPGPRPAPEANAPEAPSIEPAEETVAAAPPEASRRSPAPTAQQPTAPVAKSAEELLSIARERRRAQDFQAAATAYRDLIRRFPGAPESHAALVSLGEIELSRLGAPAAALKSFDAYLSRGGALSLEAELGRLRALRALGDSAGEARAIAAFLEKYPSYAAGAALKQRLEEIQGRR